MIALSAFYLDPFYPEWSRKAEIMRNILFISGTILLLASDGMHRFKGYYQAYTLVAKSKEKMKRS